MTEVTIGSKCRALREAIKDLIPEHDYLGDEYCLFHWLKVNKMDLKKTEAAVRAGMRWREEHDFDNIEAEQFPPDMKSKTPIIMHRVTKNGDGIFYYQGGHTYFPKLVKKYGKDAVIRYWLQCARKLERQVIENDRKLKKNLEVTCDPEAIGVPIGIIDVEGYSMKCLLSISDVQVMFEIVQTIYAQTPTIPWIAYFINTNKFFEICLRLLKPVLQRIGLTMTIYGSDEEKWKDLRERVDIEVIREYQKRSAELLARDDHVGT